MRRAGTEIIAVNPADGPVSIEGYYDEAFSVPGLLAEIAKGEASGVSAHIIACFDDTGLEAARSLASAPVIGIGEAAFHLASMLGHRFTVITTLSRSIAAIETNLLKYGLASRCARVRASEVPVLSLDDPASNASALIGEEIERAKAEDRAEAIVLGCAGMADLAARLSDKHGLPVVDGVASAVKLAEAFGSTWTQDVEGRGPMPHRWQRIIAGCLQITNRASKNRHCEKRSDEAIQLS